MRLCRLMTAGSTGQGWYGCERMSNCKDCGRKLTHDEIALYKRMLGRGNVEFLCLTCFARTYDLTEEYLQDRIDFFKEMGCALF